jgi:hypothetical protein
VRTGLGVGRRGGGVGGNCSSSTTGLMDTLGATRGGWVRAACGAVGRRGGGVGGSCSSSTIGLMDR